MHNKTLSELAAGLRAKQFSSEELTQAFLARIDQHRTLNAFVTVSAETALQQAKAADQRLAAGDATALTGIPIAQKDIFCTLGIKTSCGSKMLDNFIAPYDATVVDKFNQAGAVCLGKLNMDEFAMGSSNETSFYGPARNPTMPLASSTGCSACTPNRAPLFTTTVCSYGASLTETSSAINTCSPS